MKKFLSIFLLAALFFTGSVLTNHTTEAKAAWMPDTGYVGNVKVITSGQYSLNVRSGPGTNYSKIGALSGGEIAYSEKSVIGSDGHTWYYVRYAVDGTSTYKWGWVRDGYVVELG